MNFSKISVENEIITLGYPDRRIPDNIGELITLTLIKGEKDDPRVDAEVLSLKQYTLKIKLRKHIDLNGVYAARLSVQSPTFLTKALKEAFNDLDGVADDDDMRTKLPENIRFVFGPPGTGKTTHLAKNELIPLMEGNENPRVLVLTPTNQAADVLVRKIMSICEEKNISYEDWLVRFVRTDDDEIAESGVFKGKQIDLEAGKTVTVTTIARYSYDRYFSGGEDEEDYDDYDDDGKPQTGKLLREAKWEYIVIDEASMITPANILLPLFTQSPEEFIIAGDPFQIKPVTTIEITQEVGGKIRSTRDDNIYTMVGLDSFTELPEKYSMKRLETQYRCVPAIGDLFSKLMYGGALKHYRKTEDQLKLNIGCGLEIKTLNIISFPLNNKDEIYKPRYLYKSAYQIYSVLLTFEFARRLQKENPNISIGIISPFRAQADMIGMLIESKNLSIRSGTVHRFQGDECDVIFVVLNSPIPKDGKDYLTDDPNILNVAVSRARDRLFVVMPEPSKRTNNIGYLRQLMKEDAPNCAEFEAEEIEKAIFGNEKYLEKNTEFLPHHR